MRELKFRAWVNRYKKYMPVWSITWDSSDNPMLVVVGDTFRKFLTLNASEVILEQCTELKDKNGKEIYDGDLLKFEDSIFKIGWYDEGARFGFVPIKKCNFSMGFSLSKCEVIGNTHNKPELLEEEC